MALQSRLLLSVAGISHGFGTLNEPVPTFVLETWEQKRPRWKQVHGVACTEVKAPTQECGEVDALYSSTEEIPIAVQTADCVPVLLASRDGKNVAAVHAGWRGTHARILETLWAKLRTAGHRPEDWVAAIGPSIGPCCYEVSEELAQDFERQFSGTHFPNPTPTHRHLDLPAINAGQLRRLGIGDVDILRVCTYCTAEGAPRFHSYRREGAGCRQWSVIKIDPK